MPGAFFLPALGCWVICHSTCLCLMLLSEHLYLPFFVVVNVYLPSHLFASQCSHQSVLPADAPPLSVCPSSRLLRSLSRGLYRNLLPGLCVCPAPAFRETPIIDCGFLITAPCAPLLVPPPTHGGWLLSNHCYFVTVLPAIISRKERTDSNANTKQACRLCERANAPQHPARAGKSPAGARLRPTHPSSC